MGHSLIQDKILPLEEFSKKIIYYEYIFPFSKQNRHLYVLPVGIFHFYCQTSH